jgi:predicted protein tyrosine phosphatase
VILPRDKVECYEPRGVEICISISDPGVEPAQLSPDFADVLRLSFSDISGPNTAPEDVLFDWDHVEAIESFMARWPHVDRALIHDMTGVSRAPAVALGICDVRGWSTSALEEAHPSWNNCVRTKLRNRGMDEE